MSQQKVIFAAALLISADQAQAYANNSRYAIENAAMGQDATPDQINDWFTELSTNTMYEEEDLHDPEDETHHYRTVSRELTPGHSVMTTLNDVLYNKSQSHQEGEVLYDDDTTQRSHYGTKKEEIVNSELTLNEREDGILEVFLDRFTTIFNHEKIYMTELPHDYNPHEPQHHEHADWQAMSDSQATQLAEQLLNEHRNGVLENRGPHDHNNKGKKKKGKGKKIPMKPADQKKVFKEELTEWIDEHTPEPMSSSDYESELEGWISGHGKNEKILTPGPHFPSHMHKEMQHFHGHRHGRNDDNEMSDRLRYNINYMEVPQAYNGMQQSNDILNLLENENENDTEANIFDTHVAQQHFMNPHKGPAYAQTHYGPTSDPYFTHQQTAHHDPHQYYTQLNQQQHQQPPQQPAQQPQQYLQPRIEEEEFEWVYYEEEFCVPCASLHKEESNAEVGSVQKQDDYEYYDEQDVKEDEYLFHLKQRPAQQQVVDVPVSTIATVPGWEQYQTAPQDITIPSPTPQPYISAPLQSYQSQGQYNPRTEPLYDYQMGGAPQMPVAANPYSPYGSDQFATDPQFIQRGDYDLMAMEAAKTRRKQDRKMEKERQKQAEKELDRIMQDQAFEEKIKLERQTYYMKEQQQIAQEQQKRELKAIGKPVARKTYGTGPGPLGPVQQDEYQFDMAEQEFKVGSLPSHTYGGQRPLTYSEKLSGPGYRYREPTYDRFGMEIGDVDIGLSQLWDKPEQTPDKDLALAQIEQDEFLSRLRAGSREATEDWDYVLGGLGIDSKMEKKRRKRQQKRSKKIKKNEEDVNSDSEWDDFYDQNESDSDFSSSDSNENNMSSSDSDSVADPEEARKIEHRFQELFGHVQNDAPLLNLVETENVSGLASSFEMLEQFEQLEQQVAHANAIGAKPKPAADEINVPVDEIFMPIPVSVELIQQHELELEQDNEQEDMRRFMDSVIQLLL